MLDQASHASATRVRPAAPSHLVPCAAKKFRGFRVFEGFRGFSRVFEGFGVLGL